MLCATDRLPMGRALIPPPPLVPIEKTAVALAFGNVALTVLDSEMSLGSGVKKANKEMPRYRTVTYVPSIARCTHYYILYCILYLVLYTVSLHMLRNVLRA